MTKSADLKKAEIIPLFGRDEMNLAQLAFGPISPVDAKSLEFSFDVFDPVLKREVTREITIAGSEKYGLPKPIDDQVLIGMKALTHEAGYESSKVYFSGYQLCKTIGWTPNGDSYSRLEESFDRILGTTLKFKNAWWDKGERKWRTDSFHLINNYSLCTRAEADRERMVEGSSSFQLSSFVWNDVIWKSLNDGYIKDLDMEMFRKIRGRRRSEVALRLFRILDKRFYRSKVAKFDDLRELCERQICLGTDYSLSQLKRIIDRAVAWLVECEFLSGVTYGRSPNRRTCPVKFTKCVAASKRKPIATTEVPEIAEVAEPDDHQRWLETQTEASLCDAEIDALNAGFGTTLERNLIERDRAAGKAILDSGRIRQEFIRKFAATLAA